MVEFLTEHWSDVLEGILALLGFASIVARLTPTEADNKVVDAVYRFVHTFGLTKRA